jgi:signal transduction histidine kinase
MPRQNVDVCMQWTQGIDFMWLGFPGSLAKVVQHLVENSFRYGYADGQSGTVDVRLKAVKDKYRLEVEDHGIGVSPELLARLFQPFVTSARESGHAGLGLAVVHTLVTDVLGGTITCSSQVGKGTKFVVTIPRAAPARES